MLWLTALLFFMTLLEIFVLVQVSHAIGGLATVLLIIAFSAVGAWMVKHEGMSALRRVVEDVRLGRMPTASLVDGFLVVFAGALLLTPGFVTATIGLVMAVPAVRRVAGGRVGDMLSRRVARQVRIVGAGLGSDDPFPFGSPRPYSRPFDGGVEREDVIDLDAEEVVVDDYRELGPGGGP